MKWLGKGLKLVKRPSVSLGIDISRHCVKAVEIRHAQDKKELLGCYLSPLKISEGEAGLIKALKGIVGGLKSKSPAVNVGIAGDDVIARHVDMPAMSDGDLRNALKYEAQKYMLSKEKTEDLITDFHKLPEVKTESDKVRIIFVAAKRQHLEEYVNLFKKGGIHPVFVDVSTLSLINCFNFSQPQGADNQSIVLLNIDYEVVNMSILENQIPYFSRDISLEEGEWSNLLLPKLDEFVFALGQAPRSEQDLTERFNAIRPLLDQLSREVKLSINYYESQFEKTIKRVYVSGEATRSKEALGFFSEQLGVEVSLWDPFAKVSTGASSSNWEKLKSLGSTFALAVGLALRS